MESGHCQPEDGACVNTDRELFRETAKDWKDEGYQPRIFVTQDERIGINVGGQVYVRSIREWHRLIKENSSLTKYLA